MKFFLTVLFIVAAFASTGLFVVYERHRRVALAYEIDEARRVQEALEEELKRLEIDRNALLSPTDLKARATARGLRAPGPGEVVVLPIAVEDVRRSRASLSESGGSVHGANPASPTDLVEDVRRSRASSARSVDGARGVGVP